MVKWMEELVALFFEECPPGMIDLPLSVPFCLFSAAIRHDRAVGCRQGEKVVMRIVPVLELFDKVPAFAFNAAKTSSQQED